MRSPQTASADRFPEIPGYRIVRRLGRGSQGAVFLGHARDDLAKPVALKYFPPIGKGAYRRELETFRAVNAARRESGCTHLVEGFTARELPDGAAFIAMAYCAHGTLADLVRARGPLPDTDAIRHVLPILTALEVLHERGLYHKDVKPSNILLASDGTVRLGDFGLARGLDQSVTQGGTPGFTAPEVVRGDRRADGVRIDVYAVGATLFFLLTGAPPLPGTTITFALQNATTSVPIQDAIIRALHVDPTRRWSTTGALRLALEEAASRGPSGRLQRNAVAAKRTEAPTRQRFGRITIFATIALAFAAAGVYRAMRNRPTTLAAGEPHEPSPRKIRADARGLVFRAADGQEDVAPLDEPVATDPGSVAIESGGPFVAAVRVYPDLRLNRLYLFDRRTHQRAAGWARPMVLTLARDAPRAWAPRFDPYDATTRWFPWSGQLLLEDLDQDGAIDLLAGTLHPKGLASVMLLCIDPRTRMIRGGYQQFGTYHLFGTADVDGDGLKDVLLGFQANYVRMEGTKSPVTPGGCAIISGRAFVSGRRVTGPPSLPGREDDLGYVLLYTVFPLARYRGLAQVQHPVQMAWDPARRQLRVTLRTNPTVWNDESQRFEPHAPGERATAAAYSTCTFRADGTLVGFETDHADLSLLPPITLVAGGVATDALRSAEPGTNNGVAIRRLWIPKDRMIPKKR